MAKSPILFLLHIRDAINSINTYIKDQTFEQFRSDRKTQDAVIRQLEIIGEATTDLENDFKTKYPKIPWREIGDFRNVLAHEYWDIDIEIVWKAATKDIEELNRSILPIIKNSKKRNRNA